MRVLRAGEGATVERTGAAIFEGQVWGRTMVTGGEDSEDYNVSVVHFGAGARTRPHSHSRDQVLYVVAGIGKVGAAGEEHLVSAGDLVLIPAGEAHWHGAADTGSPMSHVTVTRAGSETTVLEE